MKFDESPVLTSQSMTGTSTISSSAMYVGRAIVISIQAYWTGTPNGTMKLQGSNDPTPATGTIPYTVPNWSDLTYSTLTVTGASGNYMWNISDCGFKFVRLTYTNTSSSGTLSANLVTKGY